MPGTTVVILYPYTYHTVYHISCLDALYFGSLCCILLEDCSSGLHEVQILVNKAMKAQANIISEEFKNEGA